MLRCVFFCDPLRELRDGSLRPLDGGSALRRFATESARLGVAFFDGTHGRMFAWDGHRAVELPFAAAHGLEVTDVAGAGRTFLTTDQGAYEVTGAFPALRFTRLNYPEPRSRRGTPFVAAPGGRDVLLFGFRSIYLVGRGSLVRIWTTRDRIDRLEGTAPGRAGDGWLFVTGPAGRHRYHLLHQCSRDGGVRP